MLCVFFSYDECVHLFEKKKFSPLDSIYLSTCFLHFPSPFPTISLVLQFLQTAACVSLLYFHSFRAHILLDFMFNFRFSLPVGSIQSNVLRSSPSPPLFDWTKPKKGNNSIIIIKKEKKNVTQNWILVPMKIYINILRKLKSVSLFIL